MSTTVVTAGDRVRHKRHGWTSTVIEAGKGTHPAKGSHNVLVLHDGANERKDWISIDELERYEGKTLRARYLDNAEPAVTHSDYYGALVEHIGERALRSLLPGDRSPAEWRELLAVDPHLNNVQLKLWDCMDLSVRRLLRVDAEHMAITGSRGWSVSDSVCVLKETARRYAVADVVAS
jgi:hypothetical protein